MCIYIYVHSNSHIHHPDIHIHVDASVYVYMCVYVCVYMSICVYNSQATYLFSMCLPSCFTCTVRCVFCVQVVALRSRKSGRIMIFGEPATTRSLSILRTVPMAVARSGWTRTRTLAQTRSATCWEPGPLRFLASPSGILRSN